LREVESLSDLRFVFTRASYARCLLALKSGQADLVAHVPYKAEPGFSEYGIYLDWTVPVKADLVSLDPANFAKLDSIGVEAVGVPLGNLEFAAASTGIPKSKFYEVHNMSSLVKMLALNRIDMIWFDRVSVRQELAAQGVQNAYYYELPKFGKIGSLGIGLAKSARGEELKRKLDALIPKVDLKPLLEPYLKYLQLDEPRTGQIRLPKTP